jgi:hypothetical protein
MRPYTPSIAALWVAKSNDPPVANIVREATTVKGREHHAYRQGSCHLSGQPAPTATVRLRWSASFDGAVLVAVVIRPGSYQDVHPSPRSVADLRRWTALVLPGHITGRLLIRRSRATFHRRAQQSMEPRARPVPVTGARGGRQGSRAVSSATSLTCNNARTRRSGAPVNSASQADSAGSIPVTRSKIINCRGRPPSSGRSLSVRRARADHVRTVGGPRQAGVRAMTGGAPWLSGSSSSSTARIPTCSPASGPPR